MGTRIGLLFALLGLCAAAVADNLGPPVELLEGLRTGQITAEFRGAGDTGVMGIIRRGENGPSKVIIEPGTQFWAQTGGRQGQGGLGGLSVGLGQAYAQVWIPTACTNFNLRAPTADDVMIPSPCPSPDMAAVCRAAILAPAPRPVVQVAVWVVANDPPRSRLSLYLRQQSLASEGELTPDDILAGAANLLTAAGLDPTAYRLFR